MAKKTNTREIGFEVFIEEQLVGLHGYRVRSRDTDYNKARAMDGELVLEFIRTTQTDEWRALEGQYGDGVGDKFLDKLDAEIAERGLLSVMREGFKDHGVSVRVAFSQPQNSKNQETQRAYEGNILSVMRQVKYSEKNENSIDMVVFLNGLPIFTIELKNQLSGQSVIDGVRQYRSDRDQREKLLSFGRCFTHFAIDTEQVFMATKLEGLRTYFLPFNKGYKEGAGNPPVEKKYKTHYMWEDVLSKESVLDLVANFIQKEIIPEVDERGRARKKEKLIFPRYHQRDAVRRLVADARDNGAGKNYLIQHSAGSGKSNTIAWVAHRLAELHNEKDAVVFDGVVVLTDRLVLDKQLSDTVESFAQVRGVVQHVESGKELQQALEAGKRIIVSTLFKFPVIVDTIDSLKDKRFAVIVDEAHSSQSGEAAADVRQVLSVDTAKDPLAEAEKIDKREEKAFKTSEDMLVARMRARKVRSPNVSFLAFTATPKQKTLELFGIEDPISGKFVPFSLYSMKQAIEEKFIVDVLRNYTTYERYFALLKKVEDDPEYDRAKTHRLLLSYVDKHTHAIDKKTEVIVEHFEEKVAREIAGKAKAMIVTKSRLHAVRFKVAFDRYLAKKGYSHRALVAFSGTVRDGGCEYTETQMNGVPEAQTAEEFKKDECRFLIVAEKFQTGFDQPLLAAMYVDKKLDGVHAVQTLSRLNRTHPDKGDVFVLDFVNPVEDIQKSFQPYYTTTILSEATDPNIIHNCERDVMQFKLFTRTEVEGFVEMYLSNSSPDKLNAALDAVVKRTETMLPDEMLDLKSKVGDFVRKYGFISQIVTFQDTDLERLFIFLKFLARKLPKIKDPLPYEVLEAVDMDTYKIAKQLEVSIKLESEEGVIDPIGKGPGGAGVVHEEPDPLSKIIREINERYGTNFSTDDKVILNSLSERLLKNEDLEGSIKHNSPDAAKVKFDKLFQDELVGMLNSHFDLYKKLDENPELRKFVNERVFEYVSKKVATTSRR